MRDTKPSSFEPTLGNCLMDSDPEVVRLARANRRRSLVLSSLIQAALLTAAVVLPLFASQAIPAFRNEPRLPAPRGIRVVDVQRGDPGPRRPTQRPPKWSDAIIAPPRIPTGVVPVDDRYTASQSSADPRTAGCAVCVPDGARGLDHTVFSNLTPTITAPKAPVADAKPRFVRVSPPVQEAKLIHRVKPVYPPLALQTRREGRVELHAIIATDGTIRELKVLSGDALFIQSSLDAVSQWRYQPTLLGNEPVEVQTHITVIFVLNR